VSEIDWVRATFVGAVAGGVAWAVIILLITTEFGDMSGQARAVLVIGAVNAGLLLASWLLWRSPKGKQGKTLAAALWIVPFIGAAFYASIFAVSGSRQMLGF
jgi:hypothetical protein